MFIIEVNYKKPLEAVDRYLAAHRAFLDRHYADGLLLCSGPRTPRTGGIILCRAADRAQAEALIAEDPFRIHNVADYTLVEFSATKCAEGLEPLFRSES